MIKRVFNHWLEETVKEITKRNLTEIKNLADTDYLDSESKQNKIFTIAIKEIEILPRK